MTHSRMERKDGIPFLFSPLWCLFIFLIFLFAPASLTYASHTDYHPTSPETSTTEYLLALSPIESTLNFIKEKTIWGNLVSSPSLRGQILGQAACDPAACGAFGAICCPGISSCVNWLGDSNNCGGCGIRCGPGVSCSGGVCQGCNQTNCNAFGAICCAGISSCINWITDTNNCGGCGVRCSVGQTCESGVCTTTCVDTIPSIPVPLNPANNATNVSINTNIDWSDVSWGTACPGPNQNSYAINFRRDGAADNWTNTAVTSFYDPPGSLQSNTRYLWQVLACNGTNIFGDCTLSAPLSFTTETVCDPAACGAFGAICCPGITSCVNWMTDTNNCGGCGVRCSVGQTCESGTCITSCTDTSPSIPIPISPTNGATNVSVTTNVDWSNVSWGTACPGPNLNSYAINFRGQGDPDNWVNTGITSLYDPPGSLLSNMTYLWQVLACNGTNIFGDCTLSAPLSFTTAATCDPAACGAFGAICCAGITSCINWMTDTNNCGGCGVRCSAGQTCGSGVCTTTPTPPCGSYGDVTSDGFVTNTDGQWVLECSAGTRSMAFCPLNRADVNASGTVDATDANLILNYASGAISTFPACSCTNAAPAAASLSSPSNGATGVSVNTNFDWVWNGWGTSCTGEDHRYILYLEANDSTPDVAVVNNQVAGTASYDPPTALLANTIYYWQTRKCNGSAGCTNSIIFSFTTAPAPSPPCENYGDVNADGVVTNTDADRVNQCIAGIIPMNSCPLTRADVSGDGTVEATDVNLILNYVLETITTFPACTTGPPTCQLTLSPDDIIQGSQSTLTWSSQNTTSCAIDGPGFSSATCGRLVPESTQVGLGLTPGIYSYRGEFCNAVGACVICAQDLRVLPPPAPGCTVTEPDGSGGGGDQSRLSDGSVTGGVESCPRCREIADCVGSRTGVANVGYLYDSASRLCGIGADAPPTVIEDCKSPISGVPPRPGDIPTPCPDESAGATALINFIADTFNVHFDGLWSTATLHGTCAKLYETSGTRFDDFFRSDPGGATVRLSGSAAICSVTGKLVTCGTGTGITSGSPTTITILFHELSHTLKAMSLGGSRDTAGEMDTMTTSDFGRTNYSFAGRGHLTGYPYGLAAGTCPIGSTWPTEEYAETIAYYLHPGQGEATTARCSNPNVVPYRSSAANSHCALSNDVIGPYNPYCANTLGIWRLHSNVCDAAELGACTRSLALQFFGEYAADAVQVCRVESGGDPWALNDNCLSARTADYSVGLFQINLLGRCPLGIQWTGSFANPQCNIVNQTELDNCMKEYGWGDPIRNTAKAREIAGWPPDWSPTWGAGIACGLD